MTSAQVMVQTVLGRLCDALESLPGAGEPHIVERIESPAGFIVRTVAGARFSVVLVPGRRPMVATQARYLSEQSARWSAEPYDVYSVQGDDYAAVEVRSLTGESVLLVEVLTPVGSLGAEIVQEDAVRWEAEDDERIGPDFQDFAERNVIWEALGGARPGGWSLTVVECGERWPFPDR